MTCRCRSGECDPECDGPKLQAEIERLTGLLGNSEMTVWELLANDERLRAACQAVVDTCHGAGAEHWAACEQARRALEQKP